jgi:hypothetical protein
MALLFGFIRVASACSWLVGLLADVGALEWREVANGVVQALLWQLQPLYLVEEVLPVLHRRIVQLVQLRFQDRKRDAVDDGLAVKQVQIPNPQNKLDALQALHVAEHGHHPTMQEVFVLQIDSLELAVQQWLSQAEELIEEIHAPLDLRKVVGDEMLQEEELVLAGGATACGENQIREAAEDLLSGPLQELRLEAVLLP